MEQSPSSEANSRLASQEIPGLLWSPKVHYRVHNNPPLVCILSQMHSARVFTLFSPRSILILPLDIHLRPLSDYYIIFPDQNFVSTSHIRHVLYMSLPSHPC
jgi:hypothetical protein